MESAKLVKRNKVPFVEHLCVLNPSEVVLPEKQDIHDDLKWELIFYNMTLEDAKKGVEYLLQSKVKIGRPDDFFAEMFKSDI